MTGLEMLVGGWFASPVIKSVVEKAQKYLGANYELQKSTQGMVEELTNTLLLCQATVTEVEKRAIINNPALAELLRRLKLASYDAEDVLDNMEAKSIKEKVTGKNKVSKFASSSLSAVSNMFSPDDLNKRLKKVVDKLKDISSNITPFVNLINMNENRELHIYEIPKRETTSQLLEKGLYGRQDELNLILDIILDSDSESSKKGGQNYNKYNGIFFIPIVGMGGVGKTALAQAVYNHPEVRQNFASKAWISVSNNHDVVLVMRKIIQSLRRYAPPIWGSQPLDVITLEDVSKQLSSIIGGVKFLMVLDDMFESQWEYLYGALSRGNPGSVVLITTQNKVFANAVGTFGPIALNALDQDKFWELFKHFAFGDPSNNWVIPLEKRLILKSLGKKIADKLGGLPLAAKIIGNTLRSKVDEDKWRDISKSEWWDIPEAKSRILASVGLGYEQLDPCLRQCFAYCSIFPRNSLIEKDRLVHMWIAQNFIQSDVHGVKKLEDIGKKWFDELVEKSFLQRAWDNNSYLMNEIMHDLAVIVSSGECFYLGEELVEIPLGVRHLTVDTNNLEVIKRIQTHKNLRSLLYFGSGQVEGMYRAINDMLSKLDSIRVLDLSYMFMENNTEPPPAIWNLQHLRFLDLSSTSIKVLTHSSIDLYHLQALYIRKCKFQELPRGINKLINLRHLCADEEIIAKVPCIGQLTNLQELGVFFVDEKEGHRITELRYLREIRGTLRIMNFHRIKNKDELKLANLADKKYLDGISLCARHTLRQSNVDMEILEELQPHKDIKDLRIRCYAGSVFPNWIIQISNFLNLKTLFLISCDNVEVLPPLGELPSLNLLHIINLSSVKLINYHLYGKVQTVFPLLEELVLSTLFKCEEWTDAGGRVFFPRLSKLTIGNNTNLRKAPLHLFGSSLKELIINDCNSLILHENSIPRLFSLTLLKLHSSSMSITFDPHSMPLLEDLHLENYSELEIKGDLHSLTLLKRLKLHRCSNFFNKCSTMDRQKGKGLQVHQDEGLQSLTHIEADHSLWHHEYHLILGSLHSLRVLKFKNSEFTEFTSRQILWFQELAALQEIHFSNCGFVHLPASLTQLSFLKKVVLEKCTKLESFADRMPPNLQELSLLNCSQNLARLCQTNKGQNWKFTSSIPVIHIDNKDQILYDYCRRRMEIRKPLISDAIEQRPCASCGKIFELKDLILRRCIVGDFKFTNENSGKGTVEINILLFQAVL